MLRVRVEFRWRTVELWLVFVGIVELDDLGINRATKWCETAMA